MPLRHKAEELSPILGVLSHPDRLRLVQELRDSEKDVQSLQASLGVSQSRVSQHLAVLRARKLVRARRQGRRVFYRLTQAAMADWLVEGLTVLENLLLI